jgi:hypothetical protein
MRHGFTEEEYLAGEILPPGTSYVPGEDGIGGPAERVEHGRTVGRLHKQPATSPCDLASLLDAVRASVRDYVVMSDVQADAVTLWLAHTHALDAFETTPFLGITSPEKRCGKSRLLDVLELFAARPWRTIMPSEAVVFRKLDNEQPTLLLDEVDAIFSAKNGSNTEPLRALLNAGNRRGTAVPRCVGPTQTVTDFQVFSAKALAGIGSLPDTIADRSVPIRLARKRPDEQTQRFRVREARERAGHLHLALASWAQDAIPALAEARPRIPTSLDDRAEEAWEPLLAIAELADERWAASARTAAQKLSGATGRDEEALGVRLLADIHNVFTETGTGRLTSATLATLLADLEESPWGDLWGKSLDARGLARRLRPFETGRERSASTTPRRRRATTESSSKTPSPAISASRTVTPTQPAWTQRIRPTPNRDRWRTKNSANPYR